MTKVRILRPFRDIDSFYTVYVCGQVVEFHDERANTLVAKGFAEFINPAKTTAKKVDKERKLSSKSKPTS